jgi:hypothetical protein
MLICLPYTFYQEYRLFQMFVFLYLLSGVPSFFILLQVEQVLSAGLAVLQWQLLLLPV